jgi:hypothetical protein
MKPITSISVVLFALMAFGHLLRVLAGWEILINATVIPMWPSGAGLPRIWRSGHHALAGSKAGDGARHS